MGCQVRATTYFKCNTFVNHIRTLRLAAVRRNRSLNIRAKRSGPARMGAHARWPRTCTTIAHAERQGPE